MICNARSYRWPKSRCSNEPGKPGSPFDFRSDAKVAQLEYAFAGLKTLYHNCTRESFRLVLAADKLTVRRFEVAVKDFDP